MPLSSQQLHDALRTVKDPDLHRDLVALNMVKDVHMKGDDVYLHIELTTPACPMKDRIQADIERAIRAKGREAGSQIGQVSVEFSADVRKPNQKTRDGQSPLPGVKHIIAVGAGKGGVGKSTVAAVLACGLARFGAKVGLLDGDIYGPSMTTMLGLEEIPGRMRDANTLMPFEAHGIKAMTIGKLVDPEKALIWRGPMAHGAFKQLAMQTDWGELDYLIVDLPPGTGDVPLTLAQLLPLSGAVVVCTPQKVAQDDARRAVRMFQQLGVEVLGIVENMSYFVCEHGSEYDIFGRGGAELMAQAMNLPFLGAIPIYPQMRINCDRGRPLENWKIKDIAATLDHVCQTLAAQVSIATMSGKYVQPTLSIR
ncbi:MAG: Mrp/NBP35 family ATP-binding protein [Phycisphaerales bacterium]|nr:Mrp/NBP35 family ATP-binding protein [Phycisphaerales bacterium]